MTCKTYCRRVQPHPEPCLRYQPPALPRCRTCGRTADDLTGPLQSTLTRCQEGPCGVLECGEHRGDHVRVLECSPTGNARQREAAHAEALARLAAHREEREARIAWQQAMSDVDMVRYTGNAPARAAETLVDAEGRCDKAHAAMVACGEADW